MFSILLFVSVLMVSLDATFADGILSSLTNGICVCTNEQNVAALRDRKYIFFSKCI